MSSLSQTNNTRSLLRLAILTVIGIAVMMGSFIFFSSSFNHPSAQAKMIKMSDNELSSVRGRNLLNFVVENGTVNQNIGVGQCAPGDCDLNINTTNWTYTRLETDVRISGNFSGGNSGAGNEIFRIEQAKFGHYDDSGFASDGSSNNVTDWNADGFCTESDGNCKGPGTSFHNPEGSADFDIDIRNLEIGRDGPNQNHTDPIIKGPYLEMVWDNMQNADPSDNKLIGFRVGAEGIAAGGELDIRGAANASGFFAGEDFGNLAGLSCAMHRGNAPVGDGCGNIDLFQSLELGDPPSNDSNPSDVGDNDKFTEDFWLSFNNRAVFYEFSNPIIESNNEPNSAQAWAKSIDGEGFWIHVSDDVEGGL